MVSLLLVDTLADPTRSLLELYDSEVPIDNFPKSVARHFSEIFKTDHAFNEIPALDVKNPPECHADRALVRFRAMVQDNSKSPELYVAKRPGARPGGWGLHIDDNEADYANLRECAVIWAVSVPGETEWCSRARQGSSRDGSPRAHHISQPHKFPVQDTRHVGLQVKLYDTSSVDQLKTTALFDFVGILSSETMRSEIGEKIEVPTLHVLFFCPVPPSLVPRPYPVQYDDVMQVREELLHWIADEALGGDLDAAEWLLLVSIARVQSRTPQILPPSLTLCRFPAHPTSPSLPPTLTHVLYLLLPLFLTVPVTLPLLNTHPFAPESKNEDLHSGLLQLAEGTRLILTEGGVREGTIGEKGIANLRATQDMMNAQRISYKFPFSEFTFTTDVQFIVLSEGRKSAFFETRINIPLMRKDDGNADLYKGPEEVKLPGRDMLDQWRALVGGALVGAGNVIIGEETSKYIQEDFVSERQRSKDITSEDLSLRMCLAKLMTLSMHGREVTGEVWDRVKALDVRRKERVGVS